MGDFRRKILTSINMLAEGSAIQLYGFYFVNQKKIKNFPGGERYHGQQLLVYAPD